MRAQVIYQPPYRTIKYQLPVIADTAEFSYTESYTDPEAEVVVQVLTDESWAMWTMRPRDFESFVEQLAIDVGVMQHPVESGY